ncbi:MAG TPA: GTP-dependent dephospho-CoA kinase family protein [Nitrososphaeraceae archaeon]|nr:GTP-dependent dephospho-CoA kinase family protein [Nitrososphaeraceae archaeon]
MPLNPDDVLILKTPFGTLIQDEKVTKDKIKGFLKNAKKVISVGDSTTDRLISFGILPDLSVIDGKERRLKRSSSISNSNLQKELRCSNSAGTISREAVSILQDALRSRYPVRVIVDGEEDMLAVPIFSIAPDFSVVLYGQPLEGIVIVKITPETRKKAKDLMDRIGFD